MHLPTAAPSAIVLDELARIAKRFIGSRLKAR